MSNIDFSLVSSEDIENALGQQLEAIRLSRNITQNHLAKDAGVSRSTVTRLAQDGKGISLDSFIRILKALQLQDHLQALLPDPGVSPLQRLALKGHDRQRARPKKLKNDGWIWDDKELDE